MSPRLVPPMQIHTRSERSGGVMRFATIAGCSRCKTSKLFRSFDISASNNPREFPTGVLKAAPIVPILGPSIASAPDESFVGRLRVD